MILQEHLLVMLAEECAEVAHRASKALRFGLREIQDGQPLTNADRIVYEFSDLSAIMHRLYDLALIDKIVDQKSFNEKQIKIDQFLEYSKKCGTLNE